MKFYDVLAPKDYEIKQDGQTEKKTAWNKIGLAWHSKSGDCMIFELYHVTNQKYVISLKEHSDSENQEAPF